MDMVTDAVGHPVGIRSLPRPVLSLLGLVNPLMKGLAEMSYEFEAPFVLDTTKYKSIFGNNVTPLRDAVAATVAWYGSQRESS
jgi:hypothetical protein